MSCCSRGCGAGASQSQLWAWFSVRDLFRSFAQFCVAVFATRVKFCVNSKHLLPVKVFDRLKAVVMALIVVPLMLFAFCSGVFVSVLSLCLGWRMAPKRNKNNALCFLAITVCIFLWVAVLLPLASTSIGANNLDELPRFLLFIVLVGATPSAACPAILLYGGSVKTTRKPE